MTFRYLAGLLALSCFNHALANDWPNYRGPHHDGISRESDWSTDWEDASPPVLWSHECGIGFSSIVVAHGRVLTMGNRDGKDQVVCIDEKTGKSLWNHSYSSDLKPYLYEGGPGSTPTIDTDKVYTLSRWGDLFCLSLEDGKVVWQRQIQEKDEVRIPDWGLNGSCLVHGDTLIINARASGMAFNKDSGQLLWTSDDGEAGYSSPAPVSIGGEPQVIISSGDAYSGIDPASGQILWQIPWFTRYGVNAASPIVTDKRVFVSSGYSKGAALYEVQGTEADLIWKNRKYRNQINSSVLVDGHLYGFDGDNNSRAKFKCVAFETGKDLWETEEVSFGSLIGAGDLLLILSEEGNLLTLRPSPEKFEVLHQSKILDGRCWATPVLANGRLYARNADGKLVCLDARAGR